MSGEKSTFRGFDDCSRLRLAVNEDFNCVETAIEVVVLSFFFEIVLLDFLRSQGTYRDCELIRFDFTSSILLQ